MISHAVTLVKVLGIPAKPGRYPLFFGKEETSMLCRKATPEDLEKAWAISIARHPDNPRWSEWREEYLRINKTGAGASFVVLEDEIPVAEGTLLFSPDCSAIRGRTALADGVSTANLNALRIRPEYEGQGHVSAMIRKMEAYAAQMGIRTLTIGVEAREARNLAIYLHWGYTQFVMSQTEEDELVLYYAKTLN